MLLPPPTSASDLCQKSSSIHRRIASELQWACLSTFLSTLTAFSGSNGLDPQLLDQRLFLAIWIKTVVAIGRSRVDRRWDLAIASQGTWGRRGGQRRVRRGGREERRIRIGPRFGLTPVG
ncbi:hypothetical protein LINPERHAP2_LOCUS5359 [Linum perenne]